MALLQIRIFGDPVLRSRAAEVADFDERLAKLAADMLETMIEARGIGLAATQVGVLKRLFTWELPPDEDGHPGEGGAIVNPEILEVSEELQEGEEGCLSFPGLFYPSQRPLRARLAYQGLDGDRREISGEGLLARVLLHELDHLNGILFLDHLALHDRRDALKRIRNGELERPPREEERVLPA